ELPAEFIFRRLPPLPEIGMVAILLAALVVIAGRLDVAVRIGAEPGVAIGGRKADAVQPVDLVAVGDPLSAGVEILPVTALPPARDARQAVIHIAKPAGHRAVKVRDGRQVPPGLQAEALAKAGGPRRILTST